MIRNNFLRQRDFVASADEQPRKAKLGDGHLGIENAEPNGPLCAPLAVRPERAEYSRQFGVHPGNTDLRPSLRDGARWPASTIVTEPDTGTPPISMALAVSAPTSPPTILRRTAMRLW